MSNTEKKKWSKKKKIIVIVLCIIAFLLVAIVGAGLYALNWYCTPVEREVTSAVDIINDDIELIAHRGFSAVAPENTFPAFDKAGAAGYSANECDVYRTADGVWVIQHDFNTYRMTGKIKNIAKSNYDDIKDLNITNGINVDQYPDLKICTLEQYLNVCQKYNMGAVIELKGNNDTQYFQEIVDMINTYPNVETTFISFDIEDLKVMSKLCDNELLYLVSKITDEAIQEALAIPNCGINFDGNKEANWENDAQSIKDCVNAGLVLGAWTIDDKEVMQNLIDLGVTKITTNSITY